MGNANENRKVLLNKVLLSIDLSPGSPEAIVRPKTHVQEVALKPISRYYAGQPVYGIRTCQIPYRGTAFAID